MNLVPLKALQFRLPQFSDIVFEFVIEGGRVTALRQSAPSGVYTLTRK